MSIAAVPNYLGSQDPEFYLTAPPGHRFLLYLALWGENAEAGGVTWRTEDRVPRIDRRTRAQRIGTHGPEWDNVPNDQFACTVAACKTPHIEEERPRARRPRADPGLAPWKPLMESLRTRQEAAAGQLARPALLCLETRSTAPFTTGLGNEHPLENGFAFLNPYGLPYLPGSGVKGVLREAARELASGDWGESQGWSLDRSYEIRVGKDSVGLSVIDVLFGLEPEDGSSQHVRGALSFWDVIPQIKGDSLMVEIMTPHQSHYYQQNLQHGSASPHDSGQPNPISFLTVPPGSEFTFYVVCDLAHLRRLAPGLAESDAWKTLLRAAFAHAFAWCGFGAKTAVGYGAMAPGQESEAPPSGESGKELSQEEQQIQGLRNTLAEEIQSGQLSPSGRVANDRVKLLKAALEWESVDLRQAAAEAIAETLRQLGWSKKAKTERAAELERLRRPK